MKRNLVLGSSVVALTAITSIVSVAAQEDGEDVITVTGFRQSLEQAADIKRNADGVVDAITAEDIGKFPDTNLAESLQRITGVSIDRQNGEGQQISVRGFGPGFNMVTLNGRQMPNASSPKQEGADTRAQVRAFNFAEISADSVAAIEVYKTSRADLPTGGIGATVNVKTARPLDLGDEYVLTGSVKVLADTSNEAGDDWTPELTGIAGKRWDLGDGAEFGVLFNGSFSKRDSREEIVSTDGWLRNRPSENAAFAANVDSSAAGSNAVPGVIFSPRNLVTDISDHSRERSNAQLVLQYGNVDRWTATVDYTYSDYKDEINRAQTAVWFDQNLVQGTANENGTIVDPTIVGTSTIGTVDYNAYYDEVQTTNGSLGLNFNWQVTDNLSLDFDVHDSESHAQPDGRSSDFLGILASQPGVSYTALYGTGSDVPQFALQSNGIDITDPTLARGNIALQRGNEQLNEITEYNLRGVWENEDGGALQSIEFGAGFIDYAVETTFIFDLDVFDGGPSCGAACADLINVVSRDGDYGDGISGVDRLPNFFFQYDVRQLESVLAAQGIGNVFELVTPVLNEIVEESTSFYAKANFEDTFNGMPVRLNAGVRYESTDVSGTSTGPIYDSLTWISSTELRAASSSDAAQNLGGEYDVWLPSIDASMDVRDDVVVRLSYGRSLSRPDLNLLRPNLGITDTRPGGPYQAIAGNPGLLPYVSDNIDATFEWYYGEGSYFSVAAFKKFVDNYITSGVRQGTIFSEALGCALTDPSTPGVNPPTAVDGGCTDPTAVFDITSFVNSEAAEVEGFEVAIQHLFGETGFGVQANATFVEGDTEFDPSALNQAVALTGLSDSANFVAFYDKNGFQARVAYNWRDEFLFSVDQLRQSGEPVFIEEYGQWDASASYEINDRYSVFAEGINLNDATAHAHGRFDEQFVYAFHGGPRYGFGLRGKF